MSYIIWDSSLRVHIDEIDEQHKKLFALINDLHKKMVKGLGVQIIDPIIDSLYEYAILHFSSEERYMAMHNYPEFSEHKEKHAFFLGKIEEFQKKYNEGEPLIAREILLFLGQWYRKHILKHDKKVGKFLKEKGVSL